MQGTDRAEGVGDVLGVVAARFVRASNVAIGGAGALVLVGDLVAPRIGGAGSWPLRAVATTLVVAAVSASAVDVDRAVETGQGRAVIRLFPLAVAVTIAAVTPVVGQGSVLSLGLLLAIVVASLTSTERIALATVAVQVLAELWAAALAPSPDLSWSAATIVVGTALWWVGRSAVTGLEELLEAQEEARRRAEQLAETRHDFVATVSHELRTPTTVIAGLAEVLDVRWRSLTVPDRRHLVGRLRANGDVLRELVDALLDFGRLKDDHVALRRSPFDLASIASEVVESASEVHPGHDVVLETGPEAPQVVGDPVLLGRVVDNLVRNACAHTPPGTTVTVVASHAGHELQVAVSDDGPGIDPADLPRLTERYFRGGDHLNRTSRGLGLGLAFCAQVLELHGQRLEVDSTPGEGARFTFNLPLAPAPSTADAPHAPSAVTAGPDGRVGGDGSVAGRLRTRRAP